MRNKKQKSIKPRQKENTELDLLREDMQDIFIREGLRTASVKSIKDSSSVLSIPSVSSPKLEKLRKETELRPKSETEIKNQIKDVRIIIQKMPDDFIDVNSQSTNQLLSKTRTTKSDDDQKKYHQDITHESNYTENNGDGKEKNSYREITPSDDHESLKSEIEDLSRDSENEDNKLQADDEAKKLRTSRIQKLTIRSSERISGIKKKKYLTNSAENRLVPSHSLTPNLNNSLVKTDFGQFLEPDKDYYYDYTNMAKMKCKLCDYVGDLLTSHYLREHPHSEVLISRLAPDVAAEAIKDFVINGKSYENASEGDMKINTRYNYCCRVCGFKTKTVPLCFYEHITKHTGEYRHQCGVCGFYAESSKSIAAHFHSAHPKAEIKAIKKLYPKTIVFGYLCGECNFIQLSEKKLQSHVNIFHLHKPSIYKINMSVVHDPSLNISVDCKNEPTVKVKVKSSGISENNASNSENASYSQEENKYKKQHSMRYIIQAPINKPPKFKMQEKTAEEVFIKTPDFAVNKLASETKIQQLVVPQPKHNMICDEHSVFKEIGFVFSNKTIREAPTIPDHSEDDLDANSEDDLDANSEDDLDADNEDDLDAVITLSKEKADKQITFMESNESLNNRKNQDIDTSKQRKGNDPESDANKNEELGKISTEKCVDDQQQIGVMPPPSISNISVAYEDLDVSTCKSESLEEENNMGEEELWRIEEVIKSTGSMTSKLDCIEKLFNELNNEESNLPEEIEIKEESKYMCLDIGIEKSTIPTTTMLERDSYSFDTDDVSSEAVRTKTPEALVSIGDLVSVSRKNNEVIYNCHVNKCYVSTNDKMVFQLHCKFGHKNMTTKTSLCEICGVVVQSTPDTNFLENLYDHLVFAHSDLASPCRVMRRLSGDKLSIKKEENENPPEKEVTDFEALIDNQVQTDLANNSSVASSSPKIEVESEAENELTPIELGISEAILDSAEDDKVSFKISSVMSLVDSEEKEVSSLPPSIDKDKPKTPEVSFPTPVIFWTLIPPAPQQPTLQLNDSSAKEANLTFAELNCIRKSPQIMQRFLETPYEPYKCPYFYCSFSTNKRKAMLLHLRNHENDGDAMVACVYCDMKTSRDYIVEHIDKKHVHCRFACKYCLYRAYSKEYVCLHQEQTHPELDFAVIVFGRRKSNFSLVADSPPDLKNICQPYRCFCLGSQIKDFLFINEFANHIDVCHPSILLKCAYPGCINKIDSSLMVDHWQMFHEICIYQCGQCKMSSKEITKLYYHFAQLHPNLPPDILVRSNEWINKDFKLGFTKEAFDAILHIKSVPQNLFELLGIKKYENLQLINYNLNGIVEKPSVPQVMTLPVGSSKPKRIAPKSDSQMFIDNIFSETEKPLWVSKGSTTQVQPFFAPRISARSSISVKDIEECVEVAHNKSDIITQLPEESQIDDLVIGPLRKETEICTQSTSPVYPATTTNKRPVSLTYVSGSLGNIEKSSFLLDNITIKTRLENSEVSDCFTDLTNQETSTHSSSAIDDISKTLNSEYPAVQDSSNMTDSSADVDSVTICEGPSDISANKLAKEVGQDPLTVGEIGKYTSLVSTSNNESDKSISEREMKTGLTGSQLYRCAKCKRSFSIEQLFMSHLLMSTSCKPKENSQYQCVHCDKFLKTPRKLFDHIHTHGIKRFGCTFCDKKFTTFLKGRQHMKNRHFVHHVKVIPVKSTSFNIATDEFVLKPGRADPVSINDKEIESECPKQAVEKCVYNPDQIEIIPIREIFDNNVKCGKCNYQTKARVNIISHLQMHLEKKQVVPDTAAVKHVPCSKKNEKIIDEMNNLSDSSLTGKIEETNREKSLQPAPIPKFKPWSCCLCMEKTHIKEDIESHVMVKHGIDTRFKCTLCAFKNDDNDSFKEHFKETHPDNDIDIICVYKLEEEPSDDIDLTLFGRTSQHLPKSIKQTRLPCKSRRAVLNNDTMNLFDCIDAVATGTAEIFKEEEPSKDDPDSTSFDNTSQQLTKSIKQTRLPCKSRRAVLNNDTMNLLDCIDAVVTGTAEIFKEQEPSKSRLSSNSSSAVSPLNNGTIKNMLDSIDAVATGTAEILSDKDHNTTRFPKSIREISKKNRFVLSLSDNDDLVEIKQNANVKEIDSDDYGSEVLEEPEIADIATLKRTSTSSSVNKPTKIPRFDDALSVMAENCDQYRLVATYGRFGSPHNKQWRCPKCNVFTSKIVSNFINHIFKEFNAYRFKCRVCSELAISYKYMIRHVSTHSGNATMNDIESINVELETWIHMVITAQALEISKTSPLMIKTAPTKSTDITCYFCTEKFIFMSECYEHMLYHWSVIPYQCQHCPKEFYTVYNLKHHHRIYHPDLQSNFDAKGPTLTKVLEHIESAIKRSKPMPIQEGFSSKRAKFEPKETSKINYVVMNIPKSNSPTPYCPTGSNSAAITVSPNINTDDDVSETDPIELTENEVIACNLCAFMTDKYLEITEHLQDTHLTNSKKYYILSKKSEEISSEQKMACNICDVVLTELKLRQHFLDNHLQSQPYSPYRFKCNTCNRKYLTISKLLTHSTAEHNSCYTNEHDSNIEENFMIPTLEKTSTTRLYSCTLCNYTNIGTNMSRISYHIKGHFKALVCSNCGSRFKYHHEFIRHHSKEHSDFPRKFSYLANVEKQFADTLKLVISRSILVPEIVQENEPVHTTTVNNSARNSVPNSRSQHVPGPILTKVNTTFVLDGLEYNYSTEQMMEILNQVTYVDMSDCQVINVTGLHSS